jgi:hypothetical protein
VRRWYAAIAGALLLGVLAGCGPTAGVDGDLTNGWAMPPRPVQFRPAATGCFDQINPDVALGTYAPIPCTERHFTEAYAVGNLTGAAAAPTANRARPARGSNPVVGSSAQLAAGVECARRASAFVGADWRTGLLMVKTVLPGGAGWAAGSRWFRCDLAQIEVGGQTVGRTGSLRGALAGAAALRLRCFDPTVGGGHVTTMKPMPCAGAHHAEYVGRWAPRGPTPALLNDNAKMAAGCRSVIAHYTKTPDDGDQQYRAGWIGFAPSDDDWNAGVRDALCFLWQDAAMKGSYRNAGTKKLPITYA